MPTPASPTADSLDALLPAIAAGDAAAFARWLASAEPRLRDSLRSFAAQVDTEAVLQEALLRVWQRAPRFVPDGKPEPLLRFGIRIARNVAGAELRRNRLKPVEVEELERRAREYEGNLPGHLHPTDPALRHKIEDCLRRLPKRPAAVLSARLENGGAEPDRRLAERLQMRPNTFLQNLSRARRFMADCLRRRRIDLSLELS